MQEEEEEEEGKRKEEEGEGRGRKRKRKEDVRGRWWKRICNVYFCIQDVVAQMCFRECMKSCIVLGCYV